MENKYFIDNTCSMNLKDGIEYYATGIIEESYPVSATGKDYVVCFFNPWGILCREWRSVDEIKILEINAWDYESFKRQILEGELNGK